ncbi:MAG: uroporphyrinogen-III synthase [Methanosphaera sp.]|nr:uroporphyrinogen-III synthase [Methanosphaera sp.]
MSTNNFNNKNVVITRPVERSKVLASLVEDNGGVPLIYPTLELQLVRSKELIDIVENIDTFDWIIFTSPAGVKSFFNVYMQYYDDNTLSLKIAVIGVKTEEELLKYDNKPDLVPDMFTAEGLLEKFSSIDINDKNIALPRTLSARKILPDTLEEYGANVYVAQAYKSVIPENRKEIIELSDKLIEGCIDYITFTSPLTVRNLITVIEEDESDRLDDLIDALRNKTIVASIGPITAKVLHEYNIECIEPERYTVKDMINTLLEKISE